jgi:hypothetical protein
MEHRVEGLRLLRAAALPRASTPAQRDQFRQVVERVEESIQAREREARLPDRRSDYDLKAAGKPAVVRAGLARERGLPGEALEVLLKEESLDAQGVELLLHLLIATGRVEEAQKVGLVPPLPGWQAVQFAFVTGDYQRATDALESLIRSGERAVFERFTHGFAEQVFQGMIGPDAFVNQARLVSSLADLADQRLVRGILALEAGDTGQARQVLRQAVQSGGVPVQTVASVASLASGSPIRQIGFQLGQVASGWGPVSQSGIRLIAARYLRLLDEHAGGPDRR